MSNDTRKRRTAFAGRFLLLVGLTFRDRHAVVVSRYMSLSRNAFNLDGDYRPRLKREFHGIIWTFPRSLRTLLRHGHYFVAPQAEGSAANDGIATPLHRSYSYVTV